MASEHAVMVITDSRNNEPLADGNFILQIRCIGTDLLLRDLIRHPILRNTPHIFCCISEIRTIYFILRVFCAKRQSMLIIDTHRISAFDRPKLIGIGIEFIPSFSIHHT